MILRLAALVVLITFASSALAQVHHAGVVRVSQGVMAGLLVSKVAPEYPAHAKQARIQGAVLMRVIVNKEGNVANIQLISGHPLLAPAECKSTSRSPLMHGRRRLSTSTGTPFSK